MSEISQFEQQYSTLTAEITAKIGRISLLTPKERRDGVQSTEKLLVEVQDLLDQMELSVRELPSGPERSKYELRVKSYRSDREQLEKELKNALNRLRKETSRNDLFGPRSSMDNGGFAVEDQQVQLLSNTETLERSSRKLKDSYSLCVETEQIGNEVLGNLDLQRGTINRARDRLREAEEDLGQSSKVLSRMVQRVIQNRAVLILVLAFLLIIVGVTIYFSISR